MAIYPVLLLRSLQRKCVCVPPPHLLENSTFSPISFPLFFSSSIYPFSASLQFNYFLLDFTLSSFLSLSNPTPFIAFSFSQCTTLFLCTLCVSGNVIFQLLSPEREWHSTFNVCSTFGFITVSPGCHLIQTHTLQLTQGICSVLKINR